MNGATIQCLERIAYALIETAGMQAENKFREANGDAPAYGESFFIKIAEDMRGKVQELVSYVNS